MHFVKTYYESTLKLYVTKDMDKAVEAGIQLIKCDPQWPPSYGELAEVYVKLKNFERAYALFAKASKVGTPYVGHHAFCAAQCLIAMNEFEGALQILEDLLDLDPTNSAVLTLGQEVAAKFSRERKRRFSDRFVTQDISGIEFELSETKS